MIVIDSNIYCRKLKILRLVMVWREKMGYFWGSYEKFLTFFYKALIFNNIQYKIFFIFCLTNENKVVYLQCQTNKENKQKSNNKN